MKRFVARDLEIMQAIMRDDVAYLMMMRHGSVLEILFSDDTPPILALRPYPIMVAAYYGATKCFNFLLNTNQVRQADQFGVSFIFIGTLFTLLLLAEISRFSENLLRTKGCSGSWT